MPVTSLPIAKYLTFEFFKVFGYVYAIFCIVYVTISILFESAYQIGKAFSH